jgi:hypothetical protein
MSFGQSNKVYHKEKNAYFRSLVINIMPFCYENNYINYFYSEHKNRDMSFGVLMAVDTNMLGISDSIVRIEE